MFENIVFDEHGYTDAEDVCVHFVHSKYTPMSWLTNARTFLTTNGVEVVSVYLDKDSRHKLLEEESKQKYHIIMFRGDKENPKAKSFRINKDGIILLLAAAKVSTPDATRKIENFCSHFGWDSSLVPTVGQKKAVKSTQEETKSAVVQIEAEGLLVTDDEEDDLLLFDVDDLDTANFQLYVWKKEDVIPSTLFAKFCNVPTGHINRQIKRSISRGDLTEGVDVFCLDMGKSVAFCEMNDVHLTSSNEIRHGLYLLTQVGVNNLAKYLRNEKAKLHSDAVSLSAAVIQDITRKGAKSSWLSDPSRITDVLNSILDTHKQLLETHTKLVETHSEIVDEAREREERLLCAYENAVTTNNQILDRLSTLSTSQEKTGIAKLLPWPDNMATQFKDEVKSLVAQSLSESILVCGEVSPPKHLIGKSEIRSNIIPAVNSKVSGGFLLNCGHPTERWLRKEKGSSNDNNLIPIDSFVREGILDLQKAFFREVIFVKQYPTSLLFSIRGNNFKVSLENDTISRTELSSFMRLLHKYQPKYLFDFNSMVLMEKDV